MTLTHQQRQFLSAVLRRIQPVPRHRCRIYAEIMESVRCRMSTQADAAKPTVASRIRCRRQHTMLAHRQTAVINYSGGLHAIIASCYSTSSQRPHHCCPPADKVTYIDCRHRRRLPQGNGGDCPRRKTPHRAPYDIKLVFVQKITFVLRKINKNCCHHLLTPICTKSFVDWGFEPDPTGELTALPQTT